MTSTRPENASELMQLLADIDLACQAQAAQAPQSLPDDAHWHGLLFKVMDQSVLAPMEDVAEMLTYPAKVTRVPGAKPWMLGLANIRGSLLPVIDLQRYFGAKATAKNKQSRLLIIDKRGINAGLLVPSVQGVRHFMKTDHVDDARIDGAVGAYVYEAFSPSEDFWPVLSVSALAADAQFRNAAS